MLKEIFVFAEERRKRLIGIKLQLGTEFQQFFARAVVKKMTTGEWLNPSKFDGTEAALLAHALKIQVRFQLDPVTVPS